MTRKPVFPVLRMILITITLGFVQTFLAVIPQTNRSVRNTVAGESPVVPVMVAREGGKESSGTGVPRIIFPETSYDFGTISQSGSVSHTFVFRNAGDGQLKIIKAKGS